ncbi:hypothetical protein EVAR_14463_1 [Eumeta japonica]|uniref:Uncharacterized protein n=1 Tax=Eumeta variegata TaxID=151549 RepID=A0A4C1U3A1_EUMVA|nr:hypothetical protein EVAR_14463_1 [Eumeta japonica]
MSGSSTVIESVTTIVRGPRSALGQPKAKLHRSPSIIQPFFTTPPSCSAYDFLAKFWPTLAKIGGPSNALVLCSLAHELHPNSARPCRGGGRRVSASIRRRRPARGRRDAMQNGCRRRAARDSKKHKAEKYVTRVFVTAVVCYVKALPKYVRCCHAIMGTDEPGFGNARPAPADPPIAKREGGCCLQNT